MIKLVDFDKPLTKVITRLYNWMFGSISSQIYESKLQWIMNSLSPFNIERVDKCIIIIRKLGTITVTCNMFQIFGTDYQSQCDRN